ncbi:MAG: hypothetical protein M3167_15860 [Acidobacteriota bacterium]|nr:hypothetical protein [Acidobacteriota bacterium]
MRSRKTERLPAAACVAAAFAAGLALLSGVASAAPEKNRNHFDSDAPMRAPGFFDFLVLGAPGEAQWRTVTEFNPPSAPNGVSQVFEQRPSQSIAAAVRRNVTLKDGTVSLGIKRVAGQGGVVVRLVDDKNFVALLIDPISGEARLMDYRQGRASELARGKGEGKREWGQLVVTLAGPKIAASWEGKPLLEGTDPAPAAGRAAIATAGPGIMTFDEFVLDPKD